MSAVQHTLNGFSGEWNVEKAIKKMQNDSGGSFYMCNLSDVIRKYDDWVAKIPRVRPFYAVSLPKILSNCLTNRKILTNQVKCNDDIEVLKTLASLGCSFDCASAGEIAQVMSLNVDVGRIIFANTTKQQKHIEFARNNNVNLMTFDNEDELYKIHNVHPTSQ